MKLSHAFALVLPLLAIIAVCAKAQTLRHVPAGYVPEAIPLVQLTKPIIRNYPGVNASVLGIRTGMTVSQVEAIAAKDGLGQPEEGEDPLGSRGIRLSHFLVAHSDRHLYVSSKNYIQYVQYPHVTVYFSSPTTGNRSDAIDLEVSYPCCGLKDSKKDPFTTNALVKKLIHKYGPPSFQINGDHQQGGYRNGGWNWYSWWDFGKHSLLKTCNRNVACFPFPREFYFPSILIYDTQRAHEIQPDFYIVAWIQADGADHAKVTTLDISIGDVQFAKMDYDEAFKYVKMTGAHQAAMAKEIMAAKVMKAKALKAAKKRKKMQAQLKQVPKF